MNKKVTEEECEECEECREALKTLRGEQSMDQIEQSDLFSQKHAVIGEIVRNLECAIKAGRMIKNNLLDEELKNNIETQSTIEDLLILDASKIIKDYFGRVFKNTVRLEKDENQFGEE